MVTDNTDISVNLYIMYIERERMTIQDTMTGDNFMQTKTNVFVLRDGTGERGETVQA